MKVPLQVDIELYEVDGPEEVERLRLMMDGPEIWRNLAWADAPGKGTFFLQFHKGRYAGHLIRERETGREIGFVLLNMGRIKSTNTIEVDIAIPDKADRGRGRSKVALALAFDAWLMTGRCERCYGWIEAVNEASLGMVKALGLQMTVPQKNFGAMADGPVDAVEVHCPKDHWVELREKLGLPTPFLPPKDRVYPPRAP